MKYKVGTVSVQGSYHDLNQDRAIAKQLPFGSVLALADGLGSRSLSQYGAQCLCECVLELAEKYQCFIQDESEFLTELQQLWVAKLNNLSLDIAQCYCTALIVLVKGNEYSVFHLGDGVISIIADDEGYVFLEDKEGDFSNFTDPLTEELELEKWRTYKGKFKKLQGIYLSSDGVELAEGTAQAVTDFHQEFIMGYQEMSKDAIENDIYEWLKEWPTSDDKTIAFLLREEPCCEK